jgi:hypothetical protein
MEWSIRRIYECMITKKAKIFVVDRKKYFEIHLEWRDYNNFLRLYPEYYDVDFVEKELVILDLKRK